MLGIPILIKVGVVSTYVIDDDGDTSSFMDNIILENDRVLVEDLQSNRLTIAEGRHHLCRDPHFLPACKLIRVWPLSFNQPSINIIL